MILGAGEMGELTVRNLLSQGVKRVYVSNRTFEKAVRLAETSTAYRSCSTSFRVPADDGHRDQLDQRGGYVISREEVAKGHPFGTGSRSSSSISRCRGASTRMWRRLENIYLYNIDDLKSVVESNLSIRTEEAQKANRMISDRVLKVIQSKLNADDIVLAIISLRNRRRRFAGRDRRAHPLPKRLAGPKGLKSNHSANLLLIRSFIIP